MFFRVFLFSFVLFVIPTLTQGAILEVHADGTGTYPNIRTAVEAALDGDSIVLANGIYVGVDNRNISFLGKSIEIRSESGFPQYCIVDCEEDGRGFLFESGEGPDSCLSGITIKNGLLPPDASGGGILCQNSSPIIQNCVITDNVVGFVYENPAAGGGGLGIINGSAPTLSSCVIANNSSYADNYNHFNGSGGAIRVFESSVTLMDCIFSENHCHGFYMMGDPPSGAVITGGVVIAVNCVFVDNYAVGGFSVFYGCDLQLSHCSIVGNESIRGYLAGSCTGYMNNTLISNNGSTGYDGSFLVDSPIDLACCNVWGNFCQDGGGCSGEEFWDDFLANEMSSDGNTFFNPNWTPNPNDPGFSYIPYGENFPVCSAIGHGFFQDTNDNCYESRGLFSSGYSYCGSLSQASNKYQTEATEYIQGETGGQDLVYSSYLQPGDSVHLSLETSGWLGSLYLLTDCGESTTSCVAGSGSPTQNSELNFIAETAGLHYIILDSSIDGDGWFFLSGEVEESEPPSPPSNDNCAGAIPIESGSFSIPGDLTNATNTYDPGYSGCTGWGDTGRDVVYKIQMTPGDVLNVTMNAIGDWDDSLYLVTDCSNIQESCVAGDDQSSIPSTIHYTTQEDGTYFLIADSYGLGDRLFDLVGYFGGDISDVPALHSKPLVVKQNSPNPFNPSTTVEFSISEAQTVNKNIYDIAGKLIETVLSGEIIEPGIHNVIWSGRDMAGRPVSAGVYFMCVLAGPYQETLRMALIK